MPYSYKDMPMNWKNSLAAIGCLVFIALAIVLVGGFIAAIVL